MKKSWALASPVVTGYFLTAMAYGILWGQHGYNGWLAVFSSIFLYAGSAQFLSIELLHQNKTWLECFLTIFLLNFRHIFYGLSTLIYYAPLTPFKKSYAIHSLTDETYSVVTTHLTCRRQSLIRALRVAGINHFAWIFGTVVGVVLQQTFVIQIEGLGFILTALFCVLLVEQVRKIISDLPSPGKNLVGFDRYEPLVIAIAAILLGNILFPDNRLIGMIGTGVTFTLLRWLTKTNSTTSEGTPTAFRIDEDTQFTFDQRGPL